MSAPVRIQLSRRKGWKMPPNTVKVDRTTRWGNPFRVGDSASADPSGGVVAVCFTAAEAVDTFRSIVSRSEAFLEKARQDLRGKNLACWCKPGDPCHADVLLELANAEPAPDTALPIATRGP